LSLVEGKNWRKIDLLSEEVLINPQIYCLHRKWQLS
jgi:hypothetical protein